MEIVSRDLKAIRLTATLRDTAHWIECYLHEDSLADKRYAVVERISVNSRGGNNDFELFTTDDLTEAEACYAAAETRARAAILAALA